jgi:actin-related protein 5
MYRDHCYYASDYTSETRAFSDARNLAAADRIIQFPFVPVVSSLSRSQRWTSRWSRPFRGVQAVEEKSLEELERIAEKKKESGRRLQEQVQKQRLEKVSSSSVGSYECTIDVMLYRWYDKKKSSSPSPNSKHRRGRDERPTTRCAELRPPRSLLWLTSTSRTQKRLKEAGFTSTEDLDEYCIKIEKSLQRARNKDLGIQEEESKVRDCSVSLTRSPHLRSRLLLY